MRPFLVVEFRHLTGALEEDEWEAQPPQLFETIEEAGQAAREAAVSRPGSIYSALLLGPIVGSWRAEPTCAEPIDADTGKPPVEPRRQGISLVHSERKLGER